MTHKSNIDELINATVDGGVEGLYLIALQVLEEARNNIGVGDPALDPDEAISLAASGRIEKSGAGWVIVFDTPYAAKQHEAQGFQHPRGGGPKYLERAVIANVPKIQGVVASAIRVNLLGGVQRSHHAGGNTGSAPGIVDVRPGTS